jgi:GNAT superfamily N-acetyltransferase
MDAHSEVHPVFSHVEPVLAVSDIWETISYWQEILGFPVEWTWGSPPNIGAVSWQGAHIQFVLDPELAVASKGNSIWIRLKHVDALYRFHQERKANIIAPLETKPWGMAQYAVEEINGYFLHFAGPPEDRQKSSQPLPASVRIIERAPDIKEFRDLTSLVGWTPPVEDRMQTILSAAVAAVVAEDMLSGECIGCALLLGDQASFYYVKDVMVHPDWQGRRVGTALMQGLNKWLDKNGIPGAMVGLFSGETLEPFYRQFGFAPAFGMVRTIQRDTTGK